jgi:hypothetical protein
MKRTISLGLTLFAVISASFATTAFGSTADPIKIVSVTEISTGPYKIGDVVTVEIEALGGSPEIVSIGGSIANTPIDPRNYPANIGGGSWNKKNLVEEWNPDFYKFSSTSENGTLHTVFRYSFLIASNIFSGSYPLITKMGVSDATNLGVDCPPLNKKQNYFECPSIPNIQITGGRRIANGVVKGQKSVEKVEVPNLPSSLNISQPQVFTLPRNTVSGTPLSWSHEGGSCKLQGARFPGDSNDTLIIDRSGVCSLFGGTQGDDGFEKYSFHQMINVKLSPVSISCIKGKVIKKVSGSNPKCPTGYTKK